MAKNVLSEPLRRSALHLALGSGYGAAANVLLKASADVSIRDRYKLTAFELAVKNGHMRLLLHLAISLRNAEWLRHVLQLKSDIDINKLLDKDGNNALHEAAVVGYTEGVKLLTQLGRARKDVQNGAGLLPKDLARNNGHARLAKDEL